jgi:4-amino-4-deoxy-L-arabinose transferase
LTNHAMPYANLSDDFCTERFPGVTFMRTKTRSKTMCLMLIGLFILLYIVLIGVRPLVIPDEARYSEIPREMLVSGDWVVPHLNGIRYFEKPILGYWLNAGAMWLFGESTSAVRLPSALAVGLTALLLFVWVRRFSDDDSVPVLAAAVFLLSFQVLAVGTFCVLDSLLSLFISAAIVAFYFASQEKVVRRKDVFLLLAGLACGLAFLTKGFLALVIPVLVIGPFLLWQGLFKSFLRTAWIALVPAVLIVLPWAIMIYRREPDFWHYFFWVEHIDRFIAPRGGQHPEPFWFYVPILLGGAMPWTPLAGPTVVGLRHTNLRHPMIRLALCWLVLPFAFFSTCSGKLGTYILPCLPPLAFLIAVGVLKCLRKNDVRGFITGTWFVLCAVCLLLVVLLLGLAFVPELSGSVALWKWGIAAAGLLLWTTLCRIAISCNDVHKRLLFYCAGPVLFMFSWPLVAPAALEAKKAPGAFLLSNAARMSHDSIIVTENGLTAAVCWYHERDNVYILGNRGEYAYGLNHVDSRFRSLDIGQLNDMIAQQGEAGGVILIAKAKHYAEYKEQLPNPSYEKTHEGLVWVEYTSASGVRNRHRRSCRQDEQFT